MSERLHSLEHLLESDPANPQLFQECAALAMQQRAFDVVARIADARLRALPADTIASAARAQAFMGTQDYRRAAELLERLREARPADLAFQQDLGLCHFCLRDYARAKPLLDGVYHAGERSSGVLRLLIATDHHLGLLDEAVELAEANAAPARGDAALAGTYALLYLDANRPAEASQWAAAALALNPKSVDALTVEGTLSLGRGETDRADTCFARVLDLAPQTARAFIGLGTIALLRQDFPRAIERLQRGVELMPEHVGSWHVLAWAYLLTGDLANCERCFQKALALNRNFAETHGGLAAVAALRGDGAAAERAVETALRLDPACLSAQFARSVLVGRGGHGERGREMVLAAFSRLTADPSMRFAKNLLAAARTKKQG